MRNMNNVHRRTVDVFLEATILEIPAAFSFGGGRSGLPPLDRTEPMLTLISSSSLRNAPGVSVRVQADDRAHRARILSDEAMQMSHVSDKRSRRSSPSRRAMEAAAWERRGCRAIPDRRGRGRGRGGREEGKETKRSLKSPRDQKEEIRGRLKTFRLSVEP